MTIQGTVTAITPYLVDAFNPGALDPKINAAIGVLGLLWAALGVRNSVEKAAGKAVAQLTEQIIVKAATPRPPSQP